MNEAMRALSIRQPRAWLVAKGIKPVENRGRDCINYRGPFFIHAPAKMDEAVKPYNDIDTRIRTHLKPGQVTEYNRLWGAGFTTSAIIGEGFVVDVVESKKELWSRYGRQYSSEFFTGPYGLVITKAVHYMRPVPCRGRLGFFVPELDEEGITILREERVRSGKA